MDVVVDTSIPVPAQEIKVVPLLLPAREKTILEFIYGMMLIADKYVENPRDKVSLKRIINKIKINEIKTNISSQENPA